jgi:hypothetical protein
VGLIPAPSPAERSPSVVLPERARAQMLANLNFPSDFDNSFKGLASLEFSSGLHIVLKAREGLSTALSLPAGGCPACPAPCRQLQPETGMQSLAKSILDRLENFLTHAPFS